MNVRMIVNGEVLNAEVTTAVSLLKVLREELHLLGTKDACEQGECGSCSVLLDGELVCSCLVMAADAHDLTVTTVEGIGSDGDLHPLQEAFVEHGGVQCGFCTPGFIVAGVDLLDRNPAPTSGEIREALSGNLCRCTGYGGIERAIQSLIEGGSE
ncbi:MAG: (2Fe-2S)-binding protein [Acidimicrobiia bacterium]|nr:(2Fe-2S)-binding protein [Acidimicrobiia bacterium]